MIIVLNLRAGGGKALNRWQKLQDHFKSEMILTMGNGPVWLALLNQLLSRGERDFVAAGGDGTVNRLLHDLMEVSDGRPFRLGAIGLGSSNDFHKPFCPEQFIAGIPCKIDFAKARPRDVGMIDLPLEKQRLYWLLNASLGLTAQGNWLFNHPNRLLTILKQYFVQLAILYAAMQAIRQYRPLKLEIDGRPIPAVSNLAVIKSPHFSGNFCYPSSLITDNGCFRVFLYRQLSRLQAIRQLAALSHQRFSGQCWQAQELTIKAKQPFALEFDGEVVQTRLARFSILKQRIEVCP